MKTVVYFFVIIFITLPSKPMYISRPISPQELALVASVTERRSPDFLKLAGTLIDGTEVLYVENLSGESAGLATCSITTSPHSTLKHSMDESSPDYWHTLLSKKLIP